MQERTVSVSFIGGLGNNLFQLAAAFGYAKRTGRTCVINLPMIQRAYHHSIEKYENTIFAKYPKTVRTTGSLYEEDYMDSFIYKEIPEFGADHVHLHGFFQHQQYSAQVREEFIETLELPMKEVPVLENTCFIHIRRGDYLTEPHHYIDLYSRYLPNAMAYVREKHPGVKFLVFSDDIPWCQQFPLLMSSDVMFCHEKDAIRSLVLMSKCEAGGICWNSTFSWWGAYLNDTPTKTIIFPDRWYDIAERPVDIQLKGSVIIPTN